MSRYYLLEEGIFPGDREYLAAIRVFQLQEWKLISSVELHHVLLGVFQTSHRLSQTDMIDQASGVQQVNSSCCQ